MSIVQSILHSDYNADTVRLFCYDSAHETILWSAIANFIVVYISVLFIYKSIMFNIIQNDNI